MYTHWIILWTYEPLELPKLCNWYALFGIEFTHMLGLKLTERNESLNKTIHGIHKSVSFTVFTWTPLRGLNSQQFHTFHNIHDIEARATMSKGMYSCRIIECIFLCACADWIEKCVHSLDGRFDSDADTSKRKREQTRTKIWSNLDFEIFYSYSNVVFVCELFSLALALWFIHKSNT